LYDECSSVLEAFDNGLKTWKSGQAIVKQAIASSIPDPKGEQKWGNLQVFFLGTVQFPSIRHQAAGQPARDFGKSILYVDTQPYSFQSTPIPIQMRLRHRHELHGDSLPRTSQISRVPSHRLVFHPADPTVILQCEVFACISQHTKTRFRTVEPSKDNPAKW
jgi:hypothetical protein